VVAGVAGIAAVAFGAWWLLAGPSGEPSQRRRVEPPAVDVTPRAAGPAGWVIQPAQTVALDRDELPMTGRVGVDLVLGEPSADARPLWGRILSFDVDRENRVRELEAAVVGDDRTRARIQVPVDFLTRDTYLIEVKTTEKTALPLRRYRLEVR